MLIRIFGPDSMMVNKEITVLFGGAELTYACAHPLIAEVQDKLHFTNVIHGKD